MGVSYLGLSLYFGSMCAALSTRPKVSAVTSYDHLTSNAAQVYSGKGNRTLSKAITQEAWIEGFELIFIRHGQSTWNPVEHKFAEAYDELPKYVKEKVEKNFVLAAKSKLDCDNKETDELADCIRQEIEAYRITSDDDLKTAVTNDAVKAAAAEVVKFREYFDAPLTEKGTREAKFLQEATKTLQEPLNAATCAVGSSNLIRAVDTLLIGQETAVSKCNTKVLTSTLQEYSNSGNADPVSLYLPTLLGKAKLSDESVKEMFQRIEDQRTKGYKGAGKNPIDVTGQGFELHSIDKDGKTVPDKLVNHCKFMPNTYLQKKELTKRDLPGIESFVPFVPLKVDTYFTKPPAPGTKVQEYDETALKGAIKVATDRFEGFWSLMKELKQKRVTKFIVAGHSNWFWEFMSYVLQAKLTQAGADNMKGCASFAAKHGGYLPDSLKTLGGGKGGGKLKNQAMVSVTAEGCVCMFDGQTKPAASAPTTYSPCVSEPKK